MDEFWAISKYHAKVFFKNNRLFKAMQMLEKKEKWLTIRVRFNQGMSAFLIIFIVIANFFLSYQIIIIIASSTIIWVMISLLLLYNWKDDSKKYMKQFKYIRDYMVWLNKKIKESK